MLWVFKVVWLCLWIFKGCGYVILFKGVWLCYGYLRGVVMLCVFKGCGCVMGI